MIIESPARRATSDVETDPGTPINNPRRPGLGASRRALVAPGSRACALDSSPTASIQYLELINAHAGTKVL